MRTYINSAATISHQPTFGNPGFSNLILPLANAGELQHPTYQNYIDPVLLRRMSKILRMGVTCAKDALKGLKQPQPGGIIVGTGLGCLQDTEKFLNNFLSLDGLIPPTAFILSTHNTVAGQISLSLGCHSYNITHTQNTLSFEMALIDALMKLAEGETEVLAGAADEHIPFLNEVASEWGYHDAVLTSGSSFFLLSDQPVSESLAEIVAVSADVGKPDRHQEIVRQFLEEYETKPSELSIVLGSADGPADNAGKSLPFVNYTALSGLYPTASAFAFHYAADFLSTTNKPGKALIINELSPGNLGLVLLKSIEA